MKIPKQPFITRTHGRFDENTSQEKVEALLKHRPDLESMFKSKKDGKKESSKKGDSPKGAEPTSETES